MDGLLDAEEAASWKDATCAEPESESKEQRWTQPGSTAISFRIDEST